MIITSRLAVTITSNVAMRVTDLVGNKKPQSYYRDVVWGVRKIAMGVRPAVPDGEHEEAMGWCWTAEENHWNWSASPCTTCT